MLLVAGSVASLAANVAVAEPTLIGRVVAAWPSFALTASYELLTRQVRCGAADTDAQDQRPRQPQTAGAAGRGPAPGLRVVGPSLAGRDNQSASDDLQRRAWQWALANRGEDGTLPSGGAIARAHGRGERWGRLVKNNGRAGAFNSEHTAAPRLAVDARNDGALLRPDLDQPSPV